MNTANRDWAQTEQQLAAARDELSPEGILVLGHDGRIVCSNSALTHLWHLSAELTAAGDGQAVLAAMADQVADRASYMSSANGTPREPAGTGWRWQEILLADGRTFEQRSSLVAATEGRQTARLWEFRDVTRVSQAAQPAHPSDATLDVLKQQELVGICVILKDGTVGFSNEWFAALLGRKPEEIAGRALLDFVPLEERDRVTTHLQARAAGAQGPSHWMTLVTGHDGTFRDALVRSSPIRYRKQDALLAIVVDITDLRQAERDLQFANLIIDQSPVVIYQALAQEGFPRTYISNNVSRFGYTPEEVKAGAFRFPDFVHPDDRPAVTAALRDMAEGRTELFDQDYRLVARDGSLHWIHDRAVAVRDNAGTTRAYRGTLIDVTERAIAERRLRRTNRALRTLSDANAVVTRAGCEAELLHDICRILTEVGGYMLAWIGFAEHDPGKTVRPVAASGGQRDLVAQLNLAWSDTERGNCTIGRAIRTGQSQINRDFATNPALALWRDDYVKRGCGSSAALPLRATTGTLGAVVVISAEIDAFDAEEMTLLDELAEQLSYGISALRMRAEHDQMHRRAQRSMNDTVQAITSTLEQRDPYTAGHQRNVARLAAAIAREIDVPESEIEGIILAASLHDIGKIHIPLEISMKPGKLTILETQLIQTHAQGGYDILKGINFPWPVAEMVLQHHERLDGSGYPRGLRTQAILLGAKIIAVADVLESMVTHRPYRAALGTDMAIAELVRGRERLYHAAAVDACVSLSKQHDLVRLMRGGVETPSLAAPAVEKLEVNPGKTEHPAPRLTLQQSAVMQLIAEGRSTKEIARTLNLAIGTVKTHLQHAYASLGARNRVEAIMRAGLMPAN